MNRQFIKDEMGWGVAQCYSTCPPMHEALGLILSTNKK